MIRQRRQGKVFEFKTSEGTTSFFLKELPQESMNSFYWSQLNEKEKKSLRLCHGKILFGDRVYCEKCEEIIEAAFNVLVTNYQDAIERSRDELELF